MDANDTRFHLLLGKADWLRATRDDVSWDGVRNEITLWPRVFRFTASTREQPLDIRARRGAARDAFGNWYWIAPDEQSILIRSSGSQRVSTFWPASDDPACAPEDDGGFRAQTPVARPVVSLAGLAVTEDHYLVVGSRGTAGAAGVFVFDLYAAGSPRLRTWPVVFEPFEIAPREDGGVWVFDRANRRIWELGPRLELVVAGTGATPAGAEPPPFANADGSRRGCVAAPPVFGLEQGWAVPGTDPIAIAPVTAGAVLVLDRDDGSGFGRVFLLEAGVSRGRAISLDAILEHVETEFGERPFTLVAHDFALGSREADDPSAWLGRLYVVGQDGNQAYAFGVMRDGDQLALDAQPDYYPMRLFGGRAVVAAGGDPHYDANGVWVRLQRQKRPRYVEAGEVLTPVFDGGEPGCVWHRLMLDACLPPGTEVDVLTRANDDRNQLDELDSLEWHREPSPRLRGDGPEIPYLPRESGAGRGTWELLFQKARGRYLQIKVILRGDGRSTPRIRALRAWYPRFSYLSNYLPAVYREDSESASFLERFLANIEGTSTTIEDRIASAQILFDVASAPPDALEWLGRWFGVAMDPSWEDDRRRLFLRHAMEFFAARGTIRGLQIALRLALDECVDDRLFLPPSRTTRSAMPLRIIERFRARRTPRALLGDTETAAPAVATTAINKWRPSQGGAELHRRYREAFALPGGTEFPLTAGASSSAWKQFAEATLGFVPRARASDKSRWQAFLARRYRSTEALNGAWRTNWSSFSSVDLPDRLPADGPALVDWYQFEGTVLAMHRSAHRFTVMLPVRTHTRADVPARQRRLALARKVLDLEKPAHTVYDMRFYWAMFRLGEARLGDDTLLDRGSRSPELMAPMVLGEGYLAEAFLSAPAGLDAPDRLQLGRDRIDRSARVGGP
jgi:phage tail-like protein